jgi:hypothetical protein
MRAPCCHCTGWLVEATRMLISAQKTGACRCPLHMHAIQSALFFCVHLPQLLHLLDHFCTNHACTGFLYKVQSTGPTEALFVEDGWQAHTIHCCIAPIRSCESNNVVIWPCSCAAWYGTLSTDSPEPLSFPLWSLWHKLCVKVRKLSSFKTHDLSLQRRLQNAAARGCPW